MRKGMLGIAALGSLAMGAALAGLNVVRVDLPREEPAPTKRKHEPKHEPTPRRRRGTGRMNLPLTDEILMTEAHAKRVMRAVKLDEAYSAGGFHDHKATPRRAGDFEGKSWDLLHR